MATLAVGKPAAADECGAMDKITRMRHSELRALMALGAGGLGAGSFVAHGTLGAAELSFIAVFLLPVHLV